MQHGNILNLHVKKGIVNITLKNLIGNILFPAKRMRKFSDYVKIEDDENNVI